jgi:hypothetical protein
MVDGQMSMGMTEGEREGGEEREGGREGERKRESSL